jgi:glycine cleavage system H protein
MSAGLLTYKLCDRNMQCENCPLDAALRGHGRPCQPAPRTNGTPVHAPVTFPGDRRYTAQHSWLKPLVGQDGCVRLGLDAFAASLLPAPSAIHWFDSPLRRSSEFCEIDFDDVSLTLSLSSVRGRVVSFNDALELEPTSLLRDPYDEGWLAEIALDPVEQLDELLDAAKAREEARLDARHFRRRIAHYLLADDDRFAPTPIDEGRLLTDLRELLGGSRFIGMLRELIH